MDAKLIFQVPRNKRVSSVITTIPGLPGNVLGFSASGKVTASDYETVLVPAVKKHLARHGTLRLLYHLGASFDSFDFSALWADAKRWIAE
jgi:hypothetical protein